jgi:hypothetical protein
LFLNPKLLNNGAVSLVLWWNSLNKISRSQFVWDMGGTPRTQNFEILLRSYLLNAKVLYKKAINFVLWGNLLKKIWCASRARVNLPHIGNRKCIKFVLHRNLLKCNVQNFKSEFEWEVPVKYQNFEVLFLFLDAKIVTKICIIFVLRWNLLNKTQVLTFLSWNLYKRYAKDDKF